MEARLNITWNGSNGDLPDPVDYDTPDQDLKRVAEEAIRDPAGYVPGIPADPDVSFAGFVVDRFPASDNLPARIMIRPKVQFG